MQLFMRADVNEMIMLCEMKKAEAQIQSGKVSLN